MVSGMLDLQDRLEKFQTRTGFSLGVVLSKSRLEICAPVQRAEIYRSRSDFDFLLYLHVRQKTYSFVMREPQMKQCDSIRLNSLHQVLNELLLSTSYNNAIYKFLNVLEGMIKLQS